MTTETVLFWVAISIILLCLLRLIVNYRRIENLNTGPTSSKIDAQNAVAQRERNQILLVKCNRIFSEAMKFLNACRASDGTHLTYDTGIARSYDVYMQNKRDGVIWGANIYLAIILGDMNRVICQIVYLDNPSMQSICFRSTPFKKREMWIDYWRHRKNMSRDWRILPATLTLQM